MQISYLNIAGWFQCYENQHKYAHRRYDGEAKQILIRKMVIFF